MKLQLINGRITVFGPVGLLLKILMFHLTVGFLVVPRGCKGFSSQAPLLLDQLPVSVFEAEARSTFRTRLDKSCGLGSARSVAEFFWLLDVFQTLRLTAVYLWISAIYSSSLLQLLEITLPVRSLPVAASRSVKQRRLCRSSWAENNTHTHTHKPFLW